MFGNLWSYLSGIPVDGLPAGDYQVKIQHAQSAGNRIRRSESIGTGKFPVVQMNSTVSSHSKSLTQNIIGLRRPHGYYRDFRPIFIF